MTTYIESKVYHDGAYDHSEVIEAHKNSGIVQYSDFKGSWWPWISEYYLDNIKYRAVIEDKPTEKELEEEFWDVLDQQGRMWDMQAATLKLIQEKFKAPTEAITLTRAEVNEVFPGLLK